MCVKVPRELFDWLCEYAMDLKGEWKWKDRSPKNQAAYDRLNKHIAEAVWLRDGSAALAKQEPE